jgi:hypothetical protein
MDNSVQSLKEVQFSRLTLDKKKVQLKSLGRLTPEFLIKKIKTTCLRGAPKIFGHEPPLAKGLIAVIKL